MSGFLVAIVLALLFVAGSVFALQPSPRQRQLARLRQAAALAGLRVRVQPDEALADYILAWRGADLEGARATDFTAERSPDAGWTLLRRAGPAESLLREPLAVLPVGVVRVAGGAEGLVASWHERGAAADVEAIAAVLTQLREACANPR